MSEQRPEIKIFPSVEELSLFARDRIARLAAEAFAARGIFTLVLSGGSTPKRLYEVLAEEAFQKRIDWHRVHFFFGDERFVPPDAEESNFRTANEALLSRADVPPQNVHRFLTEQGGGAEVAAEKMENTLREFFGLAPGEFPRFDLILLGMGADGHTASLFPGTAALGEHERLVTANYVEKLKSDRLTFTIPTINHARNIIFLVAGEDKAQAAREVLRGERRPEKFPAQFIRPADGRLLFLLDGKAARLL